MKLHVSLVQLQTLVLLALVLVASCQSMPENKPDGSKLVSDQGGPQAGQTEGQALQQALDLFKEIQALHAVEWSKINWGAILDKSKQALELNPDFIEVISYQAEAYERLERFSKAVECHERLIALQPDKADGYSRLAGAYARLRKPNKAMELFDKAVEMEPDNPAIWEQYGNYWNFDRQDKQQAVECYNRALELCAAGNESPWAFIHRGIALRDLGQADLARADFEKARRIMELLKDQGGLDRIASELGRM